MFEKIMESLSWFPTIRFPDLLEIIIIIFITYKCITMLKNTRAWVILKGLGILYCVYLLADILSMHVLAEALKFATILTSFVVILALQPDIRKIIERIGTKKIKDISFMKLIFEEKQRERYSDKTINALIETLFTLSKTKTGSLIVIEKDTPLDDIVASGIDINANVSSQLLINIFEDKTPLHDGAVIIRGDKILSATAYLPLSSNPSIDKALGTRHRAAIGATEASDCFVLISSEETGQISYVKNGGIKVGLDKKQLNEILIFEQKLSSGNSENKNLFKNINTKVYASCIGFILWFVLITTIDPVATKTFNDIDVVPTNENLVKGKIIELKDDKISITIEDRKSRLDKITMDDIDAKADFSKLSITNAVKPDIKIKNNTSSKVLRTSKDMLQANVDDIAYLEYPVEVELTGELKENTSIKTIDLQPDKLNLEAGKSTLKKLNKVICEIDLSRIKNGEKNSYIPKFYDKNGDEIAQNKIKIVDNNELSYIVNTSPTKKIDLQINVTDGKKSAGKIKSASYEPKNITITGSTENLRKIDSLKIDLPVDIEFVNAKSKEITKVINIRDYLSQEFNVPEGSDKVSIKINYDPYPSKEIQVPKDQIVMSGKNSRFKYEFTNNKDVTVRLVGPDSIINNVNSNEMFGKIDVSNFTSEGKYLVPITFVNAKAQAISETKNIEIEVIRVGD